MLQLCSELLTATNQNYMQKLNVEYLGIYRSLIHLQPFKDIYCIIPVMYNSFDLAKSFHMQQSVHTSIQIICSINPFTHAKWPSSLQNQHVSDFLLAVPTICASLWDGRLSQVKVCREVDSQVVTCMDAFQYVHMVYSDILFVLI